MSNFFSHATSNFSSSSQGQVDPRTGQFNISLSIAKLVGNSNQGPTVSLSLESSPFSTDNTYGLGIGCSLGLSQYDSETKSLVLSSGEQYKVSESTDGKSVSIQQEKLVDFKFLKISSTEYKIIDNNGEVEILTSDNTGSTNFRPTKIVSATGHFVTLSWKLNGTQVQLISISDEIDELCQFDYSGWTTATIWPGKSESYEISLENTNDYISSLTNNSVTPPMVWSFSYATVSGYNLINQIISPTGYKQIATYTSGLMNFPANANLQALPAVTRYQQIPGMGQPSIVTDYSYSDNNYLGYNGVNSWSADLDNLYNVMTPYSYDATETVKKSDGSSISTKHTYNNYHLTTNEETRMGACIRSTTTEYYAQIGTTFENQPAQYQFPMTETVVWTTTSDGQEDSGTYQIVTTTSFDEYGNLLERISPDQSSIQFEYYPKDGAAFSSDKSTGCPADPNGFVCHARSMTFVPRPSDFADVPTRVVLYAYDQIDALPGDESPPTYAIVKKQETHCANEIPLLLRTTEYFQDKTEKFTYGRVCRATSSLLGSDDSNTYTNSIQFTFLQNGEFLDQSSTFTGYDGLSITNTRSQSRFSGQLESTCDGIGNITAYTYDKLGRILTRTLNPGTDYENIHTTDYSQTMTGDTVADIVTTLTTATGISTRVHFDGMGRMISREINGADTGVPDNWYQISLKTFDEWGRLASTSMTDYLNQGYTSTKVLNVTYNYDDWNKSYLETFSSGQINFSAYDPIARKNVSQIRADSDSLMFGQRVTMYNVQNLPASITWLDSHGSSQASISHDYDGLGQLRTLTDECGYQTTYTYDAFGRMLSQTLPDGTIVNKTYSAASTLGLVTEINVVDAGGTGRTYDLGYQKFDSLGRRTEFCSGGRKSTFNYTTICTKPTSVTDAANQTVTYEYSKELGNAPTSIAGASLQQNLTYDPATGVLTEAEEVSSMTRGFTYAPSGKVLTETFAPANSTSRSVQYVHSLRGDPVSCTDIAGATQTVEYDIHGRLVKLNDPAVAIELTYDSVGNLVTQVATSVDSSQSLTTTFGYDDFGREIQREIAEDNGNSLSISVTYRPNDQIETRVTLCGGENLRSEKFTYDMRNRLIKYECSGSALPCDGYGQPISEQTYSYDALSNVTQCVTTTEGSSDTATFSFGNPADPCQLTQVTHTNASGNYPPQIDLEYDANGRMVLDEAGRALTYDVLGRLTSVSTPEGRGGSYGYDAFDTLVSQVVVDGDTRQLYYRGKNLVNEVRTQSGKQSRFVKLGNHLQGVSDEDLL